MLFVHSNKCDATQSNSICYETKYGINIMSQCYHILSHVEYNVGNWFHLNLYKIYNYFKEYILKHKSASLSHRMIKSCLRLFNLLYWHNHILLLEMCNIMFCSSLTCWHLIMITSKHWHSGDNVIWSIMFF